MSLDKVTLSDLGKSRKITIIKDIIPSVGRTGSITPVAILKKLLWFYKV